ncbi:hypothetical protein KQ306_09975 [Synechococcus sp. CS-1324]|uniref:asparagine synthase-related protein n=1 Tax=Synechococcus sp. CS-1324 TaxID=2847980 RepID=UPI00223ADFC7|nr:asparagine synthase-related protein [Synechococcus sp. CS-1324]MCT0231174.1 hypothetical protein [Synechococcus sp. CS-1324]
MEGTYRTDAFHRKPIFAVRPPGHSSDRPALLVRSWDEALALHGKPHIDDINPAWLGRLISGSITAASSPYRHIERLPRAHWVVVGPDGHYNATAYDPLSGGAGPLPEQELHALIRGGLLSSLRRSLKDHSGPIGCEHSSGIDSNAIVGALRQGLGITPDRLHTFNVEGYGEDGLINEFRHFHGLDANQAHPILPGWQVGSLPSDDELLLTIGQLSAPPQRGEFNSHSKDPTIAEGMLLFSGFGGDQGLSHNGANVASDLVATGRWRCLVQWSGGHRLALRALAGRAPGLISRRWAEAKTERLLAYRTRQGPHGWLAALLSEEGRTLFGPHLRLDYFYEGDRYLTQRESIRRRSLASWVTVRAEEETRMAAALGIRKQFPLLNEQLIATMMAQDPLRHAIRAGQGRLVARKAFGPFLPPLLCGDPSKRRDLQSSQSREVHLIRQRVLASLISRLRAEHHPLLDRWWHLDEAWRLAEEAVHADDSPEGIEAVIILLYQTDALRKVSLWLRWLEGERSELSAG